MFPVGLLEVSVTLSVGQIAVGPLAVIAGAGGMGCTTTVTAADVSETQVPSSTNTQYVPEAPTTIKGAVWPDDQILPVELLEVKVTPLPEQNSKGPFAAIVGVAGGANAVIVIGFEVAVQPKAFEAVTV
jgi:hypothetical protein